MHLTTGIQAGWNVRLSRFLDFYVQLFDNVSLDRGLLGAMSGPSVQKVSKGEARLPGYLISTPYVAIAIRGFVRNCMLFCELVRNGKLIS